MSIVKRVVCLANSRKLHGRCVAGIELVDGHPAGWVRPVSDREHEEVSEYERQYSDGSDPRLLDIVDVPLIEPRPRSYQQENWLIDPRQYWVKRGRLGWDDVVRLAERVVPLWRNGDSTYNGMNDRLRLGLAAGITHSLRLIYVDGLRLVVRAHGEAFGNPKRRVQARFQHAKEHYWLWVTDPVYERHFLLKEDGDYALGECCLTISIGEPYNDACYKLVAAVIEPSLGTMK